MLFLQQKIGLAHSYGNKKERNPQRKRERNKETRYKNIDFHLFFFYIILFVQK